MAKSKQGGAFGYLRGKVGSVTFSVLSSDKSSSGKKEQIVRALPESVANPQTAGQVMQRMKLAPAQKFYSAFSELLSNAFQGVKYGDTSRRYFMALAMKEEGPYVQKGVDRFIPAAYRFSQGSLPSVGIEPFSGGAQVITLANTVAGGTETITNEEFATLLGISSDYQISVVVVNNVNGIFVPSYIPFDSRLKIADLPAGTLGVADGHVTINPAALDLDNSAMVACCVVISVQDASGSWLRSTQNMVISNELRASIYGADALEAAIYSYQNTQANNAINSEWYYNLGLSQAWGGKLVTVVMALAADGSLNNKNVVLGIQQIDGRIVRSVFATDTADNGLIVFVENGQVTTAPAGTVAQFKQLYPDMAPFIEQWNDRYAAQLGIINNGGSTPTPSPTTPTAFYRSVVASGFDGLQVVCDADGKYLTYNDGTSNYVLAVDANVSIDAEVIGDAGVPAAALAGMTSREITITALSGGFTFTLDGTEYTVTQGAIAPVITEYTPRIAEPTTLYANPSVTTTESDPLVTDAGGHVANVVIGGDTKIIVQTGHDVFSLIENVTEEPLMDGCIFFADSLEESSYTWGDYTIAVTQAGVVTFTPTLADLETEDEDLPNVGG